MSKGGENEIQKKQYDKLHKIYTKLLAYDKVSDKCFFEMVDFELAGKKVFDLACGGGELLGTFAKKGAICNGIDISAEFITKAKAKYPAIDFRIGDIDDLPFGGAEFDVVVSKYALQSVSNIEKTFSEVARVLKPGGIFLYLSKHPLRQFLEKVKGGRKDYFKQETVKSKIFDGKITLREPSHTLGEYFSPFFFQNFEVLKFKEASDFPASEQINNLVYPCFFLVKARKKH